MPYDNTIHQASANIRVESNAKSLSLSNLRHYLIKVLTPKKDGSFPWQDWEQEYSGGIKPRHYKTLAEYLDKWSGFDISGYKKLFSDDNKILSLLDASCQGKQGTRTDLLYNIQEVNAPTGTSADAGLRRLRKDRPDLHTKVLSGDISVNAAMKEAGFRPKVYQMSERTPLDKVATKIVEKFGEKYADALITQLNLKLMS